MMDDKQAREIRERLDRPLWGHEGNMDELLRLARNDQRALLADRDERIKREAVLERAFAVLLCEEINGCANHSLTSAFEACAAARSEMAEEGG